MRVNELIKKLQAMPQHATVVIPTAYNKFSYAEDVEMGIFYPYSVEFVPDSNDEDDVNAVLICQK